MSKEIQIVLNGKTRDPFLDIKFPEFDGTAANVTLDLVQAQGNVIPFRYKDGVNYFMEADFFAPTSMMCVFQLGGDNVSVDSQMRAVGGWTHLLDLDWSKYHLSTAQLNNEEGRLRTFVYRIYANVEGECTEHPEMLYGAPIGQYHCPACGHMIVASLPHPPLKDFEDLESELQHGYTDEEVALLNTEHDAEQESVKEFRRVFGMVSDSLEVYENLKVGWDGTDAPVPTRSSLNHVYAFINIMRDHPRFRALRHAHSVITIEGKPTVLWHPKDRMLFFSLEFHDTHVVWTSGIADGHAANETGKLVIHDENRTPEGFVAKLVEMASDYPMREREARKMKFREQRGSLADAMITCVTLDATKEAIAARAREILKRYGFIDPEEIDREMVAANITSEPHGYDARIEWDTYLVTSTYDPMKIVGYHDGPLED